jgi:hypothetical protein
MAAAITTHTTVSPTPLLFTATAIPITPAPGLLAVWIPTRRNPAPFHRRVAALILQAAK